MTDDPGDDVDSRDASEDDPEGGTTPEEPDAETEAAETDAGNEAEATESETSTEEPDAETGLQEGDFVELAYTMRTVEDGTLVDTTDPEVAEEADVEIEEGQEFGPRTVVLGAGHVFETVEEELLGKGVGESGTVTVPASEAFGEYDPEEVRTVSAEKIPEEDRYPGAHVDVDGEHGHVETIIGGRARVDFNHPLAGEDIDYEYEIRDVVEDRLEKAQRLLSTYVDLDLEMEIDTEIEEEPVSEEPPDDEGEQEETEEVEYETLYVEAVPQLTMNQQWMFSKQQIASELKDRVGVDRVVVREVLDGSGMGPMGGMMGAGGMGGGEVDADDLEEAIDDADLEDVDADDIADELDDTESDAEE